VTHTENERLAIVETEVRAIKATVQEIRQDVKSLVAVSIVVRAIPWAALVTALVAILR